MLKERKKTFADLARETEIPMRTIYNLKSRKDGRLSARHLIAVSRFFGVSVEELCEEVSDADNNL